MMTQKMPSFLTKIPADKEICQEIVQTIKWVFRIKRSDKIVVADNNSIEIITRTSMLLSNTIMFRNFTIGLSFCTMVYGFIKFIKFVKSVSPAGT